MVSALVEDLRCFKPRHAAADHRDDLAADLLLTHNDLRRSADIGQVDALD